MYRTVDTCLKCSSFTDLCYVLCLQLLKYVPTSDEKNLLNAHNKEIENFARADRFLYDMSRQGKTKDNFSRFVVVKYTFIV